MATKKFVVTATCLKGATAKGDKYMVSLGTSDRYLMVDCGSAKACNEFVKYAREFFKGVNKCEKSEYVFNKTLQSFLRYNNHVTVTLDVAHWEKIKSITLTPADAVTLWIFSIANPDISKARQIQFFRRFMTDKYLARFRVETNQSNLEILLSYVHPLLITNIPVGRILDMYNALPKMTSRHEYDNALKFLLRDFNPWACDELIDSINVSSKEVMELTKGAIKKVNTRVYLHSLHMVTKNLISCIDSDFGTVSNAVDLKAAMYKAQEILRIDSDQIIGQRNYLAFLHKFVFLTAYLYKPELFKDSSLPPILALSLAFGDE